MTTRLLVVLGVALIALGALLGALPKAWVETALGVEPDGGNGSLELLLALLPVVAGTGLLAAVAVRRVRSAGPVAGSDADGG